MNDAEQLAQQFPRAAHTPALAATPVEPKDWAKHKDTYEQRSRDSIKESFRYSARVTFISRDGEAFAKQFKADAPQKVDQAKEFHAVNADGESLGMGSGIDPFTGSAVSPVEGRENTYVIARGFNDAAEVLMFFESPFGEHVGVHQDRPYFSATAPKEKRLTATALSFSVHDHFRTGDQGSSMTAKTNDPAVWEPWLMEGSVESHARAQFLKDARVDLTKPVVSGAQSVDVGQGPINPEFPKFFVNPAGERIAVHNAADEETARRNGYDIDKAA